MADTKKAPGKDEWRSWIGIEEHSPAQPTHEGEYTVALEPETHPNEYAEDAAKLRAKHGSQHSFPAGKGYGGSEGSGPKKPGMEK